MPHRSDQPPAVLLHNRNFILLWAAYTISAMGDHLSEMGLLEMQDTMSRGDSTRIQAVMTFAFFLPFALLAPAMGWLADRLPRKWVMIAADLVRFGLMLSLFTALKWMSGQLQGTWLQQPGVTHHVTGDPIFSPWVYSAPLLITGIFAAMFSPSRAAMLPTLVREDQIVRANALTNAMGPLATIVSYALGGYLVSHFGIAGVHRIFQLDGLTFLASALLILGIRPPPSRRALAREERVDLLAGFRYLWTHRRVAELAIFATVFWIAASTVRSVVPAVVKDTFHGTIAQVAYFQATIGIGILIGALILSIFGEALRQDVAISWSLIGAGLSVAFLTILTLLPGSAWFWGFAALFGCGFFGAGVLVGTNALVQKIVPDCFRGRVISVNDLFAMSGLLLATGVLGLPEWPSIDRYVPLILGAMALMLLAAGVVAVRIRLRRGKFGPAITFFYNLNYLICRGWHRARRVGPCTIPGQGPVIVAANHISSLDPFALSATSPNRFVSFMIAREYYDFPVVGHLIKLIECVPVNRSGVDTASIKTSLRHLASGRVLGIFPQGGIRDPAEREPPREGVGMLALRSGAAVVPAYVSGIEAWSGSIMRQCLRRQRAVVRYGKPIDLSPWQGREGDRAAYKEVSERIMSEIWKLADEAAAN